MPVAEKFASVYRRGKHYFVHANAQTIAGFWLASEPGVLLTTDGTPQELGNAVLTALSSGASGVATPSPQEYRAAYVPLLAVANVRSWRALQRSASLCEVWQRGNEIVIEPTRNSGTRGDNRGYHRLPELALRLEARCSAAECGEALRSAFERCQGVA